MKKKPVIRRQSEEPRELDDGKVIELIPSVLRIRRILVPVDFSSASMKALQYGLEISRQFDAEILVIHVVEPIYGLAEMGPMGNQAVLFQSALKKESLKRLHDLCDGRGRCIVHEGKPFHVIIEAARKYRSNLVVMGTHGYTGFARLALGSTTEKVVRHAHCPVLVVRDREKEFISVKKRRRTS